VRCKRIKKILGAFLDQELSQRKVKQVQQHLQKCSACAWELKSLQKIDELGRWITKTSSNQMPKDYWDGFLANMHEKLKKTDKYKHTKIFGFLNRALRLTKAFITYWFKKATPAFAAAVVIFALIFGINYLPDSSSQIVIREDSEKEKLSINLYLKEHEKAIKKATYSGHPSRSGIDLGYEDLLYYNTVRGSQREWPGEAGIILRSPHYYNYTTPTEQSPAVDIVNGKRLSLEEAQEAVGFKIIKSQFLYPGYFLESIKKIEGRECLQLVYTNGISTISLFEQALTSGEKLQSSDFREYVLYSRKGIRPVNIIGWNSAEVSFTLIGDQELSYFLDIIREIQGVYLGNNDMVQ
jgi:hypothetical protein